VRKNAGENTKNEQRHGGARSKTTREEQPEQEAKGEGKENIVVS